MPTSPPSSSTLILASTSARRAELLREMGYTVAQRPSPFDDTGYDYTDLSTTEATRYLAHRKAAALAAICSEGLILGADTLVEANDRTFGKPINADEAEAMLSYLVAHRHRVITSVCLIDAATGREAHLTDEAWLSITPTSPTAMTDHRHHGDWRGKAGGYHLAYLENHPDWTIDLEGDPATVIGLPVQKLPTLLRSFFVK